MAIVLSILLAFALQAWWEALRDTAEELAVVETLVAEIGEVTAHLDEAIAEHVLVMDAADEWRNVSQTTAPDSVAALVRLLIYHRTPNLSLSAVEGLLASGRLSLIRDEQLRAWIAAWPGVKEDLDEETQGVIQFARFVVPGFFVASGIPRAAADSILPPRHSRSDLSPLVGDPRFANLYYQGWEVSEVFVREGLLVRDVLERGRSLGRSVLDRAGRG